MALQDVARNGCCIFARHLHIVRVFQASHRSRVHAWRLLINRPRAGQTWLHKEPVPVFSALRCLNSSVRSRVDDIQHNQRYPGARCMLRHPAIQAAQVAFSLALRRANGGGGNGRFLCYRLSTPYGPRAGGFLIPKSLCHIEANMYLARCV